MSAVLEERVNGLTARLDAVEKDLKAIRTDGTQLLVEVKVLATRVSLYAAAISFAVSGAMAVALKFLG